MTSFKDNKIVYINLTEKTIRDREITIQMRKDYIGGNGINVKLLLESKAINASPLSEDNVLIFGVGPAAGTSLLVGNRCTITSKSPLSGIYGDSNVGGSFSYYLRSTGIDHLVFEGKSREPVYIVIDGEGKIQIKEADDLWGLGTDVVDDILTERYGPKCKVACIGQAGENLIRFANVMISKTHAAGRTGMGCIMGFKKLKAIVVKKGNQFPSVYDEQKIKEIRDQMKDYAKRSVFGKQMSTVGSLGGIDLYSRNKLLPCYNSKQMNDEKVQNIATKRFRNIYQKGTLSCYACPIACVRKYEIPEGKYKGEKGESMDLGSLIGLGPMLGLFDYADILHIKNLSDVYGMDSIELGVAIGMAIECYEKGVLTKEQTGGIELKWNDGDLYSVIIEKIVKREGFGNILAEGTARAAEQIGGQKYAFTVKGVGTGLLQAGRKAWALGYLTSVRGGDHLKATIFLLGLSPMTKMIARKVFISDDACNMSSDDANGRVVWWHQNYKTVLDSLGLCKFAIHAMATMGYMYFDDLAGVMNALMGTDLDEKDVLYAAERIFHLQYYFNAKNGVSVADDNLPVRQKEDDIDDDFIRQTTVNKEPSGMLEEYFFYRGLTSKGQSSKKRINELGLDNIVSDFDSKEEIASIPEILQTINLSINFSEEEKIAFDELAEKEMNQYLARVKAEDQEFAANESR